MDLIDAELYPFEIDERREPGEAVTVQLERHVAHHLFHCRHERADAVGSEQAARIFQHDRIDPGALDELLRLLRVELVGVDRAVAVDERADGICAQRFRVFENVDDVVEIGERIEGAHAAQTIGEESLGPQEQNVVGHNVEPGEAFAADRRLHRRVRDLFAHEPHALPRILLEVAHRHVELDEPHEIDRIVTDPVHAPRHRQHHGGRHAGGPQRLVRVAQCRIHDLDRLHAAASGW